MKPYRIGIYEKAMPPQLSWAEKLQTAKSFGYDWVEISIDETDDKLARLDWSAAERKALVDTLYGEGLPIETMCLSGHRKYPLGSENPATRARGLDIMEKACVFACDIGIRIIQLAGYDVYYDKSNDTTKALFADGLARATEMAATYGVTLAFETMETPFLNTVAKAMYWVNQINSPWLQVYPDCGNMTNAAGGSSSQTCADLLSGAGHISALHLKETKPGIYREVPYGTGHVDFDAILKTALGMGIRMFNTEFWYTGEADWREMIRASKAFIDKKLAGAR
jgi:L-ribulose-5-phosphate 3-epimerase